MQTQVSSLAQTLLVLLPAEQQQLLSAQIKTLFLTLQVRLLYRQAQPQKDRVVLLLE
jgi:hypothetical protein